MNARQHLALCESVADVTDCMLAAARAADWDELVRAEQTCARLVANLRSDPLVHALDEEGSARKAALLRRMLANDAAIRSITESELDRLASLLAPRQHEARLARAYGQPLEPERRQ
jgi:flagellar protein FliT